MPLTDLALLSEQPVSSRRRSGKGRDREIELEGAADGMDLQNLISGWVIGTHQQSRFRTPAERNQAKFRHPLRRHVHSDFQDPY